VVNHDQIEVILECSSGINVRLSVVQHFHPWVKT